ncbi:MAG: hypothetical protein KDB23_30725, partial [Planctomycetales bacterium]|nr:hypothetical protein [Planctomycetales bacterium]
AGWELWKSDGTTEGTQRVVDLVPGPDSSSPHVITEVDGRIYFGTTNKAASEAELWLTDGTSAGTTHVSSFPRTNRIRTILEANGKAFIYPEYYLQLWTTTGTPESTVALSHRLSFNTLRPYTAIAALNDYVFFLDSQQTVWRTDGTEAGTTVFYQDNRSTDLARIGSTLYIATYHGVLASEETPESIRTVLDNSQGPRTPFSFLGGDGQLALIGSYTTLWSSNGTPDGTVVIDSSEYPTHHTFEIPLQATLVGNHLYFYRTSTEGVSLGVTDGTAAGTYQLAARPHSINVGSRLDEGGRLMAKVGDKLIFTNYDEQDGAELWISDGSEAGTHLLRELAPGNSGSDPAELLVWNHQLFIDGTTLRGIQRLDRDNIPITIPYYSSFGPQSVVTTNEAVYFTGTDGELLRTDGTQDGTQRVSNIAPLGIAFNQTRPDPTAAVLVAHGNDIYFTANDANEASGQGPTGVELWRSDGSSEGTMQVHDIAPGSRSSFPYDLTFVGDTLFFGVLEGGELWKSDGTAAGTMMVKDVRPGVIGSQPRQLTAVGNTLYFVADDGTHGRELWRSDGTAAG